jgi:hypothetical protein
MAGAACVIASPFRTAMPNDLSDVAFSPHMAAA